MSNAATKEDYHITNKPLIPTMINKGLI